MSLLKSTKNRIATYIMSALLILMASCGVKAETTLKPIPHKTVVVDDQRPIVSNGTIVWVEVK